MISGELLRILAGKGRVEIIRTLRAFPEKDFSINEIARASAIPPMTAWRGVNELRKAGLVKTRRVGNATCVKLTEDRESIRILRLIPDTDPQRAAARLYSEKLSVNPWLKECKLFGSIGRGEHSPGEEVDLAVIYDDTMVVESSVKAAAAEMALQIRDETNVAISPLFVPQKDMARKGGLAAELRDKETIWKR